MPTSSTPLQTFFEQFRIVDGRLRMEEDLLGFKIVDYLRSYLGIDSIDLDEAVVHPPTRRSIRVEGIWKLFGAAPLRATAILRLSRAGVPNLRLQATSMGIGYRLTDTLTTYADGYLDQLVISKATFELSTSRWRKSARSALALGINPDGTTNDQLRGIKVKWSVASDGLLPTIPELLEQFPHEISFEGRLRVDAGTAYFYLDSKDAAPLAGLDRDAPSTFQLLTRPDTPDLDDDAPSSENATPSSARVSALQFSTRVQVGVRRVTLRALLPRVGREIILRGDFHDYDIASLDNLSRLVGGNGLFAGLPSTILPEGAIELRQVAIGFDGTDLTSLSFAIGGPEFDVIPGSDVATVEKSLIAITLRNPLRPDDRELLARAQMTLEVLGVDFEATMIVPGERIIAALAEGERISVRRIVRNLLKPLGLGWPQGLPRFEITSAQAAFLGDQQSFLFLLAADEQSIATEIGGVPVALSDPMIRWSGGPTGGTVVFQFSLDVGPTTADLFGVVRGKDVVLQGDVRFDQPVSLIRALEDFLPDELDLPDELIDFDVLGGYVAVDTGNSSFQLTLRADASVDLGAVGAIRVEKVEFEYTKGAGGGWVLSLVGGLRIGELVDAAGAVTISHDDDGTAVLFVPSEDTTPIEIPLPIPPNDGRTPHLSLLVQRLRLHRSATRSWTGELAVQVGVIDMYGVVDDVLPDEINGVLVVGDDTVSLTIDDIVDRVEHALPDFEVAGRTIAPGHIAVSADSLALTVKDGDSSLSIELGLGLPAVLNSIFGVDDRGQPEHAAFVTYDPADAEPTMIRLRLTADRNGVKAVLLNSPLETIEFRKDANGDSWFDADMGDFGAVSLLVPQFSYDQRAQRFAASGGFEVTRPLAVPLTPVKQLLTSADLDGLGDMLPESIPLEEVQILDDAGRLRTNDLVQMWGDDFPPELTDALNEIGSAASRLPDEFKSYLRVEPLKSLRFEIAAARGGAMRFKLAVDEGDPPIRLLFPGLVGPIPGFNGIELHSVAIGSVLAGQLFTVELDAVLEQFDIVGLAASVLLPRGQTVLPTASQVHQRFDIRDLFMLVAYQAGVPVPIPVFYRKLGFDSLGFTGFGAGLSASFPQPEGGIGGLAGLLVDMLPFFTEPDTLLEDDLFDRHRMGLVFSLDAAYIQLPKYLGGETLGKKSNVVSVSVSDAIVDTLNWFKRPDLSGIIQLVPITDRVGAVSVAIGPLKLEAKWLITTADEFVAGAHRRLGGDEPPEELLAIVPQSEPDLQTRGLLVFLRGRWAIDSVIDLRAAFALVSTGQGFGTSFQFRGTVVEFIQAELSGSVVIDPTPEAGGSTVRIAGHSYLDLGGHRIFNGDVQLADDRFALRGTLNLFPPDWPLAVGGTVDVLIDEHDFHLFGSVSTALAGVTLASATLAITPQRFHIRGEWLGVVTTLDIHHAAPMSLTGTVEPTLVLDFSVGPIVVPFVGVQLVDRIHINAGFTGGLTAHFSAAAFSGTATFGFVWGGKSLNVPPFHVAIAPPDVDAMGDAIIAAVEDNVGDIFGSLFDTFGGWFRAAWDGLADLADELAPALAAAGQWSERAWARIEQWGAYAWASAAQWGEAGWQATTEWVDAAWDATTEWGEDAWDATTEWGEDAWAATTEWGDAAWAATTEWGEDAWAATTEWGDQAWKDTTEWSEGVWHDTTTWSAAQFKDFESVLATLHGDVALIPHIDGELIPHADFQAIPHADFNALPHVDVRLIAHGDVRLIPHADLRLIAHGDFNAIPHVDTRVIPHGDFNAVPHVDTPSALPVRINGPFGFHVDSPGLLHADVPTTAHIDTPSTAHIDSPATAHVDTPTVAHIDSPSTAHIDTPSNVHIDSPSTAHVDSASTAHVDIAPQHGDSPAGAHIDTP